jgi:hypothetical protein
MGVAVKAGNNFSSEGYVHLHITIYFCFSALTVLIFRTEQIENTLLAYGIILFNFLACDTQATQSQDILKLQLNNCVCKIMNFSKKL